MGRTTDLQHRSTYVRVDDKARRAKIEKARQLVYTKGASINGPAVKNVLQLESMVPTRVCTACPVVHWLTLSQNAFSTKLAAFGFNYFLLYVIDLLHEFELGIWKNTFTHLLRMLYAYGGEAIQMLNERPVCSLLRMLIMFTPPEQVPSCANLWQKHHTAFQEQCIGYEKARCARFRGPSAGEFPTLGINIVNSQSDRQCAIPVFEHLLPAPHNEFILTLLFELAYWHALAKLRIHSDTTVAFLKTSTKRLGQYMRHFKSYTCKAFHTIELPNEETARRRRRAAMDPKRRQTSDAAKEAKTKGFNLSTYKWHALGDYANTIRRYGTTDNYSTQTVSDSIFFEIY